MKKKLIIGTRGSKMALFQTNRVKDRLRDLHPDLDIEIDVILTSGDWKPEHGEARLSEKDGGKGLFAKEIEHAILSGKVDMGVHSAKDMPGILPDGLIMPVFEKREDPRDALLSTKYASIDELPEGATVATSSVRREALLLAIRPDIKIVPIRGNAETRIQKLQDGIADATFLACSGLKRLGLQEHIAQKIPEDVMLPAVTQGVIAIEIRDGDAETYDLIKSLHDHKTGLCAETERAVMAAVGGSCHTPLSALAELDGDQMSLRSLIAELDGSKIWAENAVATVTTTEQAKDLGTKIGLKLKADAPPHLFKEA